MDMVLEIPIVYLNSIVIAPPIPAMTMIIKSSYYITNKGLLSIVIPGALILKIVIIKFIAPI
jgi:hypothetical protein